MDFRLKVFCSAAQYASFTKAAELNFITQPAVTKNVQELESSLGVSLFERRNARVYLTPAGEQYYLYAQQLLKLYDQARFKVQSFKQNFNGTLSIGASTTIGQYVLPKILSEFNQQYPSIAIHMLNENTQEIENELLNNKISLGFVEGYSAKIDLKYETLMEDEIVAIIHKKHPLFKRSKLTIDELVNLDFVLRENGSGSRDIVIGYLRENNINPKELKIKAQLGSSESIKNFIKHSTCIGFLSVHALNNEDIQSEYKIIEIENLSMKRKFYAVYPHGNFDGIPELFLSFFKSRIGEFK